MTDIEENDTSGIKNSQRRHQEPSVNVMEGHECHCDRSPSKAENSSTRTMDFPIVKV